MDCSQSVKIAIKEKEVRRYLASKSTTEIMKRIDAPITAIMVYPERARITRRGTLHLPKGEHVLALCDLPMTVESDSVRASGANPYVTILHVDVTLQDNAEAEKRERDHLSQEFTDLLQHQSRINDDIHIQDEKIAFLTDVNQSASRDMGKAVASGETTLQNLTEFTQYISQQLRDAQSIRRELLKERREIEIQLNKLQPKLPPELRASLTPSPPKKSKPSGRSFGRSSQNPPVPPSRFSELRNNNENNRLNSNDVPSRAQIFGRIAHGDDNKQAKRSPSPPNPFGSRQQQNRGQSPFTFSRHPQFQSILVTVSAETDTEWIFDLSYTVQNVEWEPSYDVRIEDDEVSMTLVALIHQHTGEDWPPVPLTISNARLSQNGDMPRIRPWLIDGELPASPSPRRNFRSRFGGKSDDSKQGAAKSGSILRRVLSNADASKNSASESSGISDPYDSLPMVTFEVPEVQAIPTAKEDDQFAKAHVLTFNFDVEMDHVAVPGQAHDVYKRARVRNTSTQTLLPGTLMIFNKSEFVGKAELKITPPDETFSFQAGVDHEIKLDRKMVEQIATGPLSGNLRRTEFTYRISLVNEGDTSATIALYDHLPIARNKQIKVFIKTILPQPKDQTESNIYMWRVFLAPKQRQDIRLVFVLEHPRDMKLISLK